MHMKKRESDKRSVMWFKWWHMLLATVPLIAILIGSYWDTSKNVAVVQNDIIEVKSDIIEVKEDIDAMVKQESFVEVVKRIDDNSSNLSKQLDDLKTAQSDVFIMLYNKFDEMQKGK